MKISNIEALNTLKLMQALEKTKAMNLLFISSTFDRLSKDFGFYFKAGMNASFFRILFLDMLKNKLLGRGGKTEEQSLGESLKSWENEGGK